MEQERVSLYYESRLEQRKGEIKSKWRKWHSLPSLKPGISRKVRTEHSEDENNSKDSTNKKSVTSRQLNIDLIEDNFKAPQSKNGPTFMKAQAKKQTFSLNVLRTTCLFPPKQFPRVIQASTEMLNPRQRGRRTCYIFKLPVNFHHFLCPKLLKTRSCRKATVNPVSFSLITRQCIPNEKLESIKLNVDEEGIARDCFQAKNQTDLKAQRTVDSKAQKHFHSEVHSDNGFPECKEEVDGDPKPPFEDCSFNSCSVPNVIFYRNAEFISRKSRGPWICLCDSCFDLTQKSLQYRLSTDDSSVSSRSCSSIVSFGSDRNSLEESSSHLKNRESSPEDKEAIVLLLTQRLKDECLEEHCIMVNNYLLNADSSDPTELMASVRFLRSKFLEEVSSKNVNIEVIRFYVAYFQDFSENLLKMLLLATDIEGNNVLHFAFSNSRFDVAKLFLDSDYAEDLLTMKNKAGYTAFMICSISNPKTEKDWFIVNQALRLVDINQASLNQGQTPLMNASRYGSHLMVKLLLESGADPNIQDIDGSTALMYAAEYGRKKCVRILLSNPLCDPNIKDNDEETACSIALTAGYKDVALLIYLRVKNRNALCSRLDLLGNGKNTNENRRIAKDNKTQ